MDNAAAASDDDLLRQARSGDAAAFDVLVGRHHAAVGRLVHRLLAWDGDADDVLQDVFLTAWTRLGRFRGDSALRTWLCGIAVRQCRRSRFRRGRRRETAADLDAVAAAGDGDAVVDAEDAARVRRAVAALPTKLREVTVLYYLEEMPVADIADLLELRRGTVDVRLHRARLRLRETLDGR